MGLSRDSSGIRTLFWFTCVIRAPVLVIIFVIECVETASVNKKAMCFH
jgi:hypothetical protein